MKSVVLRAFVLITILLSVSAFRQRSTLSASLSEGSDLTRHNVSENLEVKTKDIPAAWKKTLTGPLSENLQNSSAAPRILSGLKSQIWKRGGAWGDVELYQDKKTQETFAIKRQEVFGSDLRRIQGEVRSLLALRGSEGVVQLTEFWPPEFLRRTDQGQDYTLWMKMPRADFSLEDVIDKFEVEEVSVIFERLAFGLVNVHRAGIMNNDLKPGNVLLLGSNVQDMKVQITDFGGACARGKKLTLNCDHFATTPWYAPQDIMQHIELLPQDKSYTYDVSKVDGYSIGESYTRAVDVYSLGIILYQLAFKEASVCGLTNGEQAKFFHRPAFNLEKLLHSHEGHEALKGEAGDVLKSMLEGSLFESRTEGHSGRYTGKGRWTARTVWLAAERWKKLLHPA